MRVGVLDLIDGAPPRRGLARAYEYFALRSYVAIMPQIVSAWCRQLGHDVAYAIYFRQSDPLRLLPEDLDIVFISANTPSSGLAYALAKRLRESGTYTVLGGPHAKAFPNDALRFFDAVVGHCDRTLVAEILRDRPRGVRLATQRPLADVPTVAARLPEIEASSLIAGRRHPAMVIGLLASAGCPYACDFCVDWQTPYQPLPVEQLRADLASISHRFPGALVTFHDPNFGVRFDEIFDVLESVPPGRRNPVAMEASLSVLRRERLPRLREANCMFVAPGVESWSQYSNKAGVAAAATRQAKLDQVVAHFRDLGRYVPGLQANFVLGLDDDAGDEPFDLTAEFIRAAPFAYPAINIPTPFGGTPLFETRRAEGRLLESMPFPLFFAPYLTSTLAHYDPVDYYRRMAALVDLAGSRPIVWQRVRQTGSRMRVAWALRTAQLRHYGRELRRLGTLIATDPEVGRFHQGGVSEPPAAYRREWQRRLGRPAELLTDAEMIPDLSPGPAGWPWLGDGEADPGRSQRPVAGDARTG